MVNGKVAAKAGCVTPPPKSGKKQKCGGALTPGLSTPGAVTPRSCGNTTPMPPLDNLDDQILGKVPQAVRQARQKLQEKGLPCTGQNLKDALDKKDYNLLGCVFRQKMENGVADDYKQLENTKAKQDWLAQFVLDPSVATTEGYNKSAVFTKSVNRGTSGWLTLEQLASPLHLASEAHAKIQIKSLSSRPHDNPLLAAEGVLQYNYTEKRVVNDSGHKTENGTQARSSLTADQYKEVTDDINSAMAKQGCVVGKKRPAPKPTKAEDPETKKLKQASATRSTTIRKMKQLLDRCALDQLQCLSDVQNKFATRGFPPAMVNHFKAQCNAFLVHIQAAQKGYADEATRIEANPSLKDLEDGTNRVDEVMSKLDTEYRAFKENTVASVKKLV